MKQVGGYFDSGCSLEDARPMGASKHAPPIGTFVVFRVSDEGLSRIEGSKTYQTQALAEQAAWAQATSVPKAHFTILRVMGTCWQTPKPEILTDIEQQKSDD